MRVNKKLQKSEDQILFQILTCFDQENFSFYVTLIPQNVTIGENLIEIYGD